MQTDVTRGLGIQHPVISAGMARVSQGALVTAVSESGGMGCLGGISYLPDELRSEIRTIRSQTRNPFAVDLVVPPELLADGQADEWAPVRQLWNDLAVEERRKLKGVEPLLTPGAVEGQIQVVLEEKPPVLALTFNVPKYVVDECHRHGVQVMALTGSVGRAIAAEESGVDYVVAQGTEGGGHTGYVGTMALIPAVVDAVSIPVIAAGGIVDARGLAAALSLGAGGVWVGTRFIASDEAYGHPGYKSRILEADARDTDLTKAYTGKNLRALRNDWTDKWTSRKDEVRSFPGQYAVAGTRVESAYQDGELVEGMAPAGQGVGLVKQILPAAQIVEEMVEGAEEILNRLAKSGCRE